MEQSSTSEKGGAEFEGIRLLLCENPLPPIDEAIDAASAELPRSNHYTEPYSNPLREELSERLGVSVDHVHVNAGSELILRQLFERFGQQVHLLTPTYPLFPEIAEQYTETRLRPDEGPRSTRARSRTCSKRIRRRGSSSTRRSSTSSGSRWRSWCRSTTICS
jgi:histidinol-phosphate aminotransferase